mmetsp:Transcript_5929/g.14405  ORF Transcript_5929/g.14405 Transcript_5929/m.14405 type:complete len:271 (-) Transcript_5929:506-1318(-)
MVCSVAGTLFAVHFVAVLRVSATASVQENPNAQPFLRSEETLAGSPKEMVGVWRGHVNFQDSARPEYQDGETYGVVSPAGHQMWLIKTLVKHISLIQTLHSPSIRSRIHMGGRLQGMSLQGKCGLGSSCLGASSPWAVCLLFRKKKVLTLCVSAGSVSAVSCFSQGSQGIITVDDKMLEWEEAGQNSSAAAFKATYLQRVTTPKGKTEQLSVCQIETFDGDRWDFHGKFGSECAPSPEAADYRGYRVLMSTLFPEIAASTSHKEQRLEQL